MRVNRQTYEEFANTLYAHATFEFESGRDQDGRWRDAGADLLETAFTGTMAWKMQACHIILNLDTHKNGGGKIWQVMEWFCPAHQFSESRSQKQEPRLRKLTIECKSPSGK